MDGLKKLGFGPLPKSKQKPRPTPKSRPRGRPVGTRFTLHPMRHLKLIGELKNGAGTVNLAATAREYGISRGTLLAYIKEEPGLLEALQARRKSAGQGYVQKTRGTRASRKASKAQRVEQRALRGLPELDRPMNPAVAAMLTRSLDLHDDWERFLDENGRNEDAPALSPAERQTQVAALIRQGPFSDTQLQRFAANASLAARVVPRPRKPKKVKKAEAG